MADRYPAAELTAFAGALLGGAGLEEEKAQAVAEILVEGDLLGHNTPGLLLRAGCLTDFGKSGMTQARGPREAAAGSIFISDSKVRFGRER